MEAYAVNPTQSGENTFGADNPLVIGGNNPNTNTIPGGAINPFAGDAGSQLQELIFNRLQLVLGNDFFNGDNNPFTNGANNNPFPMGESSPQQLPFDPLRIISGENIPFSGNMSNSGGLTFNEGNAPIGNGNRNFGSDNATIGNFNSDYGNDNATIGNGNWNFNNNNATIGNGNWLLATDNTTLGNGNWYFGGNNTTLGNGNWYWDDGNNNTTIGNGNWQFGSNNTTVGNGNWYLEDGSNNRTLGNGNWHFGGNNATVGNGNWDFGNNNTILGNGNWIFTNDNTVVGNGNWLIDSDNTMIGVGNNDTSLELFPPEFRAGADNLINSLIGRIGQDFLVLTGGLGESETQTFNRLILAQSAGANNGDISGDVEQFLASISVYQSVQTPQSVPEASSSISLVVMGLACLLLSKCKKG
ncbi:MULTISPECIES: hypothetical protein [unclassified Anabaena]|uniref:hypothetical protein n=1 Tax=unclassified Anabaena TaxID=2619674 RepID=UPI0039C6481F